MGNFGQNAMNRPTELPNNRPLFERPPLPTGLSCEIREGLPKPFVLRWREVGGKKRSVSLATRREVEKFAATWTKRKETWGRVAEIVQPKRLETWRVFAELTGDADPLEVARFWVKYHTVRGGSMTVAQAVEKFLEIREQGEFSRDTNSHRLLHATRLASALGSKQLSDVTPAIINDWLNGLQNPETGEPMEAYTRRQHLTSVKLIFNTAVREKWCDDNPAASIQAPKVDEDEISVMPVSDAQKFFATNRDNPCVGRLALEAFGGLRFSSAARIERDEIIDADRGIVMPGAKHKLGRRHYVDGYPDNLWAWINHASPVCWKIKQSVYLAMKSEAFRLAGVEHPHNVLRHSFCSYHIALNKDAARTAVLLTHRSPSMLYQHYRGRASEADAKAYFAITP